MVSPMTSASNPKRATATTVCPPLCPRRPREEMAFMSPPKPRDPEPSGPPGCITGTSRRRRRKCERSVKATLRSRKLGQPFPILEAKLAYDLEGARGEVGPEHHTVALSNLGTPKHGEDAIERPLMRHEDLVLSLRRRLEKKLCKFGLG